MQSSTDKTATAAEKWWSQRHIVIAIEGPDGPRPDVVVAKPFVRLGRDERAEVRLVDAAVLPCHWYLHATNDGLYCAGFAAGSLNGCLLPTATLDVGPFRVRASLADAKPTHSSPSDPQAKGSAGPRGPRVRMFTDKSRASHADLLLQRQLTLIGRQTPATWRIKHPTISRAHGAVVWDGAELWLIDFFSSNGTRVGENQCDAGLIPLGQEFRIGTVTCCYLDIQPTSAATASSLAAEQPVVIAGAGDSAVSHSATYRPPAAGEPRADNVVPERRLDAPQQRGEAISPPHASPGGGSPIRDPLSEAMGSSSALPGEGAAVPASSGPGPAALVDTRPLTIDTKFMERPQRSLEDRLAAVEVELAAQRERSAVRSVRVDAELAKTHHELDRVDAALRQDRESHRDHRTHVADLRERLLREIAQLGEQAQLVRQQFDTRNWEKRLSTLADETARRCTDLERQLVAGLQSAADQLVTVEGMMIAKVAELRARQGRLDEISPDLGSSSNVLSEPGLRESPSGEWLEQNSGVEETTIPPRVAGSSPARKTSPQSVLGDEFTHRLLDFQAKRERSAWRRRLLWTAAALLAALVFVLIAALVHSWINQKHTTESGAAEGVEASLERRDGPFAGRAAILDCWL